MAAPAKTVEVGGLLAKVETTYGTGVVPSPTTDAVLMYLGDRFGLGVPATLDYKGNGENGVNPGNIGPKKRSALSGRSFAMPIPHQFKGSGAAYSASVFPSMHTLLRLSGFTAAVTVTPGSEKWVYTPHVPGTFDGGTLYAYGRRELWTANGVLLDWTMSGDGPTAPVHQFSAVGVGNLPTDAALASITYPALTIEPPIASAVTLTLGSYVTAEVLKFGFSLGRNLSTERVNLNGAAAHQGFYPAGFAPKFTCTIEATAHVGSPFHTSAGLDPYKLEELQTNIVAGLQIGTTQYNRWKLDFPQVQLRVKPSNNNAIATIDLELTPYATTPISNDFMTVTAD